MFQCLELNKEGAAGMLLLWRSRGNSRSSVQAAERRLLMLEAASERLMWAQYHVTVSINDKRSVYWQLWCLLRDVCDQRRSPEDERCNLHRSAADLWTDAPRSQQPCTTAWRMFCWHLSSAAAVLYVWMFRHQLSGAVDLWRSRSNQHTSADDRLQKRDESWRCVLRFVWILRRRDWNCV